MNEAALAEALRSGQIAAAGIDVFAQEPPGPDNPLYSLPNCLLSPHVAGVTEAGMKGMALHVAAVIDTISRGRSPTLCSIRRFCRDPACQIRDLREGEPPGPDTSGACSKVRRRGSS
ncbi:NAD(P)-dependent oxidoreductase [Novosphingobium panipatense]|uniref:NAD(P)-dependent oxidoreductase n=1 Tax=Novosphingobium panipatense TaxID=428991 RepID=UPI0036200446